MYEPGRRSGWEGERESERYESGRRGRREIRAQGISRSVTSWDCKRLGQVGVCLLQD